MAQIQPPETFDFSTPNEWPKWRKRFERYLVVSGMKKKEEADKIDLFMYLMGDRADDIFRTFKFEKEEEATKIDSVLKAFDSHFCVRKNIIYERAKFNSRIQEDREPVDEFITSLYKLAESCEFEGLHEQLIRDRIVVGVRDKALSERMQLDSELTLEKAVKMVRQQEAVRQQQVDLQRPSESQKVNQVKFNSKKQSPKQQQQPSRKKEKSAKIRSRCPKCGGFTHREGQACRAEGQRCNLCSKTGHFANCCPDKQAKTAEVKAVSELDGEIGFLLEVSATEDSSNLDDDEGECRRRWTAEIQVNGKQVKFKLDSQADVTCVPLCLFKKIMGQQRLVESDINIRAAEFSELQTVGMFISTLRNGKYEIKEIYVIRRLSEPLLSRRACELLNLARRIEVVATRINPIKEFPEVFEGLGQIGNPYEIKLKPGAKPYAVHTPRRVPIPLMEKLKTRLEELDKDEILTMIFETQQEDTTLKAVVNYLEQGWPDKKKMSQALLSYWHVKDELGVQNGLLMRSCRLVIPASMKLEILDKLHAGHFGITKTRLRARETVWWPGISEEIAETVRKCSVCIQEAVSKHEPLIPTNFPTRPWQKIGMDLFKFENKWYLVVIDYYSRFPEMIQLDRLTANVVVRSCKSIFARHGIPETVVSDNGTQFGAAREFANFARQYGFTHVTSSPRFPQSNGMAEAGVKIAKLILKKNQDPSLGLLEYRSTPLENGYSPAELLMGRKLRTTLPIAPENLNPRLVDSQTLKRKEGRRRKDMKSRYDRRCGATDMEELSEGDTVWITDMRTWGIVKQKASTPRSYMVDTPVGTLRRNRFHLRKGVTVQYPADPSTPTFSGEELVENEKTPVVDYPSNDSEDGQIRTRSGRIVKPVCQAIGEAIFLSVPIALGFSMLTDCAKPEDRIFEDCIHSLRVKPLFCGALRWKDESSGMCCSNGKVRLPLIDLPPEPLRSLLSGENSDSVHFLRNIRKYNSCFQMTSFGAENQTHSVTFPTTFSIQGQVYHRIGSLMPSENQPSRFLQIYFMGNDDDDDIQTDRRCQQIQGVRCNIVQGLQRMLHQHNLLVQQFKTALENLPSDAYRVVVNADRTPPGQHPRRYNAPTADEVAVVLAGNQFGSRDIVLHQRDNLLQHVSDTHRFYDALQYPLIFWKGQDGYSFHIPQIDPNTSQPLSGKVSSMDFYGYFIMVRRNSPNVIVQFGQLFHQFLVDMYAKVESERLRYITLHQRNLRAESYIHFAMPCQLMQILTLIAWVKGSFYHQVLSIVPDLFITFTSNPSWEELSAALLPGQKQLDRHDITARVFRQKLVKFIGALTKGQLYGAAVAWMNSVEWQKRGLPHAHILVWLANKLRPTQIDSVICAEFPDPIQDPLLYNIVVKNMIHGPCGEYNPVSPCMKNSSCSKKYPKQFLLETQPNENGYPLYRRRAPEAGGFTAKVKIRGREEVTIDNRWVVPYSPLLSKMFCAHINVENCSSVKAIKYICKYVNKGSDQAIINLRREGRGPDPQNEVRMYQCARYISSNEAVWRLLSFPLHQRHPAVIHLAVHLENGERIYFNQNTLAHRMRNPPRTTLTAFFSLCQTDSFARTLLYPDVPQYYTWNSSAHEWRRRVQGKLDEGQPGVKRSDTIGRVYAVHVSNFECFCLRMLLHNIKGPTSFAYLKIVNGSQYETFRETCAAIGLLENDNHWVVTMDEAVLCQAPTRVRQLFAILISTCTISNPQQLWITYRDEMASDILHRYQLLDSSIRYNDLIYNETLCNIEDRVVSICGKKLQELGLGAPRRNVVTNSDILRELAYDTAELEDNVASMLPKLLPEQRRVFDAVLAKINLSQPIIIFLDAPGGTGKTFLLNLLLAMIRKAQNIAIAVASSGIAATLLAGGRTAHSVLKLPLTFAEGQTAVCNIRKNSDKASLLRSCKLLVWDECTMAHKIALEALDRTLQDIRDDPQPMGGLVVLLAGDFRQTLPVVTRGTPADELNACLKSSYLWSHIVKMHLTVNMRVQLHNDTTAAQFADELLKIGEGQLETDSEGNIQFSNTFCQVVESSESLYEKVFPNIGVNYLSEEWLCARTILAPKNSTVLEINNTILNSIPGESKIYRSIDTMVDPDESVSYPPEFLNSLELSGTPSHKIVLKVGVPVILIRNIDPPRLCNGTRLCITQMGTNVLQARILTGSFRGEEVLIPRIPIIPNDLPFKFRRLQFPVMVAFAMTINKSQGQTLQVVGVHLESPCFSHGQLYVACSRVSSHKNLFVFSYTFSKTRNIVYQGALI
ncbi:hypothetical protein LAZ67_5001401 [Cordylochernes scorpioides]|uniref:ATP-dependent DNA helicase n=1 Tax=Cordylochernes scorpioides TaxID=51811 RepID=A0ABY6KGN4_9ARAC|nr:hypothetical protein LAZ67_5001401 [Cordylochernes scorpioides]